MKHASDTEFSQFYSNITPALTTTIADARHIVFVEYETVAKNNFAFTGTNKVL